MCADRIIFVLMITMKSGRSFKSSAVYLGEEICSLLKSLLLFLASCHRIFQYKKLGYSKVVFFFFDPGGYDKEEKAARAYDLAALKYWGPCTATNFPV